ncbi:Pleckstrin homology domain-containing family N member 1 [Microtus ochrogaster]|uniref:Pleckstrin homology domain-containing family N member 1 n=1 Tax=Microtus ochrogaster TaxID=79684 RepID=A0A8J6GP65_MICOH|nr:Pleckstrin homology domain-containing family N member 1 [Microtus ochrogaster]
MQPRGERPAGRTQSPEHSSPGPGPEAPPPPQPPAEDSSRKLAGLFGTEARPDGDTAANKIFHYIPGTNQTNSNCVSTGRKKTELRHSGSSQSPRGKVRREVSGSAVPLPLHLDLTKVSELDLDSSSEAQDHSSDIPHSPLYADPYTPPATSHRKITDLQGLDEQFFCAMQTSPGPELSSPFPSVSVSVPVSDSSSGISSSPRPLGSHLLSKKGALQPRASQKHRGSIKNRGPRPSDLPQLVTPARESTPSSLPPPPDEEAPNWNKTSSPSPQKWPQLRKTPVEMGLIQWI